MKKPLSFPSRSTCLVAAAAIWALGIVPAQAQSSSNSGNPAARPAAKPASSAPAAAPAAAAKTPAARAAATEPGLRPGEKPMSREELRVCLKRSDDLVAGRKVLEDRQNDAQRQRQAIEDEAAELKAERDALQSDVNTQMAAFRTRVEELNARIKRHSELAADINENRRTLRGEQQRQFESERTALQTAGAQLNAEREQLVKTLEDRNRAFNAKASARDARVADWNQVHGKLLEEIRAAEAEAEAWRRECGNRPYREDDEKAIRAGK